MSEAKEKCFSIYCLPFVKHFTSNSFDAQFFCIRTTLNSHIFHSFRKIMWILYNSLSFLFPIPLSVSPSRFSSFYYIFFFSLSNGLFKCCFCYLCYEFVCSMWFNRFFCSAINEFALLNWVQHIFKCVLKCAANCTAFVKLSVARAA